MNTMNSSKRHFLKSSVAAVVATLPATVGVITFAVPTKAHAVDPLTLVVVGGLLGLWSAVQAANIQSQASERVAAAQNDLQIKLERMRMDFNLRLARFQLGHSQNAVMDEFAFTRDGHPVSQVLVHDFDGYGTGLGLNHGATYFHRGRNGGLVTSVEGALLARGVDQGRSLPVPSGAYYPPYSPEKQFACRQISAWTNIEPQSINVLAMRHYSSAPNASSGAWDLSTVLFANQAEGGRKVYSAVLPRTGNLGRSTGEWTAHNIETANSMV